VPREVTLDAESQPPGGMEMGQGLHFGVDDPAGFWLASYAHIHPPRPFEAKAIYAIPPRGLNAIGKSHLRWGRRSQSHGRRYRPAPPRECLPARSSMDDG